MKPFPVYRIDRSKAAKIRIGALVERREKDRGNNLAELLKLAVCRYKSSPNEIIQIDFMGMVVEI